MNNSQFRKLMLADSAKQPKDKNGTTPAETTKGSALGSRQRASIPMTPRSVGGAQADFARQLAERNNTNRPQRKFKSSDPRGIKLATGYVDRSKEREDNADDARGEQLKELEEALKNEEIDQETFEKRRFEIAGGDLSSTHLVKGLDFKLLKRIKEGEDVYGEKKPDEEERVAPEVDIDDEFDQLEDQEVMAVVKEKEKKKGQLSTVALAPGKKRTRDQILAELKASRAAAKAQQDLLGDRFKKIGAKQKPGTRIERDRKGREVLIIVDEDGHEKRKVRKIQPGAEKDEDLARDLLMPDKDAKPLGMEVPEQYRKQEEPKQEEEEDIDIFDGVGDDYDPLAGMDGSDSESDGDDTRKETEEAEASEDAEVREVTDKSMPPPPKPLTPSAPRNYFKDAKTGLVSEEQVKAPSMSDPAIMAAIKRAAALNPIAKEKSEGDDDEEDEGEGDASKKKSMEERRKRLLQMADRDDEDLDMGFGTSRFEDEEDFDESRVKLSTWGKDDGGEGSPRGGSSKRKRAPKKRKGDANSAADVLRVMEERKKS
ncbi:hypothetical protein EDB81DRAFT_191237 [Dactylonectria macrodidyma]|uniref:RED-like N-terminal domain-containing protein n=1 Tax=Dactylonectria macrodidyma TaxID=307937 RepID=A0A9P9FPK9_9HYPO|nr:hypothetical protein EDB81DRAFT_191237 [Dactylonectria macrodidyma]